MSVDTLNQEHFSAFLDQSVRLLIAPDAVGVFDNARIHLTLAPFLRAHRINISPHRDPKVPQNKRVEIELKAVTIHKCTNSK